MRTVWIQATLALFPAGGLAAFYDVITVTVGTKNCNHRHPLFPSRTKMQELHRSQEKYIVITLTYRRHCGILDPVTGLPVAAAMCSFTRRNPRR